MTVFPPPTQRTIHKMAQPLHGSGDLKKNRTENGTEEKQSGWLQTGKSIVDFR